MYCPFELTVFGEAGRPAPFPAGKVTTAHSGCAIVQLGTFS